MGRNKRDHHDEHEREDDESAAHQDSVDLALEDQIQATRAERDEALGKYQRALADFQNYQRRALQAERDARSEGGVDAVKRILPVLDYFDMALKQDPHQATAAQIIEGVRLIKGELLRALAELAVTPVEPEVGERADPARHEAVGTIQNPHLPPASVARVVQPGYRIGDRVIRAAKVLLTPSHPASEHADADEESADEGEM